MFRQAMLPWETGEFAIGSSVLELWNCQEGKRLAILGVNGGAFQFSPDGRRFATSTDGHWGGVPDRSTPQLTIWNTDTRLVERVLRARAADELRFSPDSQRLLAVNAGEQATLFEVNSGREARTWKVDKGDWQAFALNPDGTWVVSGGEDKLIRLWDAATGRELTHWQGHESGVSALLFIASQVSNARPEAAFPSDSSERACITYLRCYSKDGHPLYSGSQDGTLKLWSLPFIRKELKSLGLDWEG